MNDTDDNHPTAYLHRLHFDLGEGHLIGCDRITLDGSALLFSKEEVKKYRATIHPLYLDEPKTEALKKFLDGRYERYADSDFVPDDATWEEKINLVNKTKLARTN